MSEAETHRNEFDVAMELTYYFLEHNRDPITIDFIQDTYAKFYALSKGLKLITLIDLAKLVDNPEIAQILNEYR